MIAPCTVSSHRRPLVSLSLILAVGFVQCPLVSFSEIPAPEAAACVGWQHNRPPLTSLECADLSALWSAATRRGLGALNSLRKEDAAVSRRGKAATGGVPGAAAALGCSRRRTAKVLRSHRDQGRSGVWVGKSSFAVGQYAMSALRLRYGWERRHLVCNALPALSMAEWIYIAN